MGTSASVVSKLEAGGDVKLSTLQRYCTAIGEKFAIAVRQHSWSSLEELLLHRRLDVRPEVGRGLLLPFAVVGPSWTCLAGSTKSLHSETVPSETPKAPVSVRPFLGSNSPAPRMVNTTAPVADAATGARGRSPKGGHLGTLPFVTNSVCPHCRHHEQLEILQVADLSNAIGRAIEPADLDPAPRASGTHICRMRVAIVPNRDAGFLDPKTLNAGFFTARVCCGCGYTELFVDGVDVIPVDGTHVAEIGDRSCARCSSAGLLHVRQIPDENEFDVSALSRFKGNENDPAPRPGTSNPLRLARLRNPKPAWLFGNEAAAAGLVEALVCKTCTYAELYTRGVEQIPVDGAIVRWNAVPCARCAHTPTIDLSELADLVGDDPYPRSDTHDPSLLAGEFKPLRIARVENPTKGFFAPQDAAAGIVQARACTKCCYTELWTRGADLIPIDGVRVRRAT